MTLLNVIHACSRLTVLSVTRSEAAAKAPENPAQTSRSVSPPRDSLLSPAVLSPHFRACTSWAPLLGLSSLVSRFSKPRPDDEQTLQARLGLGSRPWHWGTQSPWRHGDRLPQMNSKHRHSPSLHLLRLDYWTDTTTAQPERVPMKSSLDSRLTNHTANEISLNIPPPLTIQAHHASSSSSPFLTPISSKPPPPPLPPRRCPRSPEAARRNSSRTPQELHP
ncbi:hypothetical protein F1880_003354 [Penicillium rolfsii]|nr:hypothetical protein F1880_003354 [Penicillium rolfsii]